MNQSNCQISHGVDWEIEQLADALWSVKITFISSHRKSEDPKEIIEFMKLIEEKLKRVRKEVRRVREYYAQKNS